MSYDYSKFDKKIDVDGLKEDLDNIETNKAQKTGDHDDVPVGDYEVSINTMELTASSKGDPMVKIWFKVLAGEHKGRYIFWNQVITRGFQIHAMNTFLRSLETDVEVVFDTYKQYGDMLLDIHEAIINDGLEYLISYTKDKKDFAVFAIKEIFETEASDDDTPF